MRTVEDSVRSVRRYVGQILGPRPLLAEIALPAAGLYWTTKQMVAGALNVDNVVWHWLLDQSRAEPTIVGAGPNPGDQPPDPSAYYARSDLLFATVADMLAAAAAANVTVPTTGVDVAVFAVPQQPQWSVRTAFDRGEVKPPYARVKLVGPVGTSGPSLYYELTQPMAIECYPGPADTADEATINAMRVQQALIEGFREGTGQGRPKRIPLYDYVGVDVAEAASERHPSDFLKVQDFTARLLPNPADERMVGVVGDLRCTWRRDVNLRDLRRADETPVRGTRRVQTVTAEIQGS